MTDSCIGFTLKMDDGEKWSRKIYFEIPPCWKMVIFITEFEILRKSPKYNELEENGFRMEKF